MGPSLDGPNAVTSLTQRRQAASNLPAFELPPPSHLQLAAQQLGSKFPPLPGAHHAQPPAAVGVSHLLTPPSNSASESGASSANIPHSQGMPVLPYTPTFWPGSGNTPGFGTGLTPQPWQQPSLFHNRPIFSPMSGGMNRHDPNSPSIGNGSALPPPPFDISAAHGYTNGMQLASPNSAGSHGHHHHQLQQQHQHHHPGMTAQMMSHVRPNSQASPISPADGVSKAQHTPGLYSSTPQPQQYAFQSSTPVSQSPHSQNAPTSTISPPLHQGHMPHLPPQNHFIKPPYPSYSLPAMPGPVMTNVSSPGGQMSLVGSMQAQMMPMQFNSGYAANPQMAYAQARAHSPQQPTNQDRPFKCDECPQSFNRNHDLKRHKRIHLAVKPFPCSHCDKSFSRKDALKRHILVKGCGKAGSPDPSAADGVKSESSNDSNENINVSITA